MARARRVKTVDEKIMEAEQLIQKKQEELASLKKDLESLKKEKQEADLQKTVRHNYRKRNDSRRSCRSYQVSRFIPAHWAGIFRF